MNAERSTFRWIGCVAVLCGTTAWGQGRAEPPPKELEGVGVTEHLNAQIPLDLTFKDEDGRTVKLGDYFNRGRPVILTLNYYRCPMLCSLQLNGMVEGLKGLDWTPGKEFEIITVSFDPLETPELAKAKKRSYIGEYGRPGVSEGWHFLTGKKEEIKALTETVGFGYRWNEDRKEYMHAAVLNLCTPDGRVARYLYGVVFEPRTLRMALVESAEGEIGNTLDRFLLYCFHYDAEAGRYAPVARRVMTAGGALTIVLLGGFLSVFWLRDVRKRRATAPD
jgi:protein SCO1/2